MTTKANAAPVIENGATVFIPLNKLKKHPKNARKTPHSEASIEGKAASIAVTGILQNLVVGRPVVAGLIELVEVTWLAHPEAQHQ